MPAFGMQCTGTGEYSPRKRIASRMSSGPVEQLRPITSTLSASSVASTDEMSVPSSILPPLGRRLTLAWIGTLRFVSLNASRMPKIAALTSRMSCAVATISRSTPPSSRPLDCSVRVLERPADGEDRRLDLEGGLARPADQPVDAALEQALGLLGEHFDELAEADLAEAWLLGRGQEAGRADAARDEAVLAHGL